MSTSRVGINEEFISIAPTTSEREEHLAISKFQQILILQPLLSPYFALFYFRKLLLSTFI